jgi:hypothetical protein
MISSCHWDDARVQGDGPNHLLPLACFIHACPLPQEFCWGGRNTCYGRQGGVPSHFQTGADAIRAHPGLRRQDWFSGHFFPSRTTGVQGVRQVRDATEKVHKSLCE